MSKSLSPTDVDARLEYMFDNVNRWLQFAEAKNGVALTASGGLLFAIIGVIYSNQYTQFHLALSVLAIDLVLVIGFSLLSFWSRLRSEQSWLEKWYQTGIARPVRARQIKKLRKQGINSLYYGHIRMFSSPTYERHVRKTFELGSFQGWQRALVAQIWINSRIAFRKYVFFNLSIATTLVSLMIAVIVWKCG